MHPAVASFQRKGKAGGLAPGQVGLCLNAARLKSGLEVANVPAGSPRGSFYAEIRTGQGLGMR